MPLDRFEEDGELDVLVLHLVVVVARVVVLVLDLRLLVAPPPPTLDLRRRFVADLLTMDLKVVVVASKEGHEVLHVPVVNDGVALLAVLALVVVARVDVQQALDHLHGDLLVVGIRDYGHELLNRSIGFVDDGQVVLVHLVVVVVRVALLVLDLLTDVHQVVDAATVVATCRYVGMWVCRAFWYVGV